MYPNIDRALFEINAIRASVLSEEGTVDLHDISRELTYRTRVVKRFSLTTSSSTSDGLDYARRKLSFACDTRDKVLAY